jgi:hypothetical protein
MQIEERGRNIMRTAIFVYESTTVTIKSDDTGLALVPYGGGSSFAATGYPQAVAIGLYKIVSASAVSVASGASSTQSLTTTSDKDKWPDPPPATLPSTMAGTTSQQISDFFVIPGVRSLAD